MVTYIYKIITIKGNFKVAFEASDDLAFTARLEKWDGNLPISFNVITNNPNSIYYKPPQQ